MPLHIEYRTAATTMGGREGHTRTTDRVIDLKLSTPLELGGPGGRAPIRSRSSGRAIPPAFSEQ